MLTLHTPRHRAFRGAGRGGWPGFVAALVATLALIVLPVSAGSAYWDGSGSGTAAAATGALAAPTNVTVAASSGTNVAVAWTASTGVIVPDGYFVTRTSSGGTAAACASSPSALVTGASCVDSGVVSGTYTYRVVAVFRSWTATSLPSSPVVVTTSPAGSVNLGAAGTFSVLGDAVTSTGVTAVSGDLGSSPSPAVTGFPASTAGGYIHAADTAAAEARAALVVAYADALGRTATPAFSGDLNGRTFTAGVHTTGAALELTGTMTLSGDANAVFIFQVDAALNTAEASHVVLSGGALASNVYWQVNGAAGTGANSTFVGTILAFGAITLGADSELIGRALSLAAVTLASNTVRFTQALPPTLSITGGAAVTTKDTTPTIAGMTNAGVGRTVFVTISTQTLTGTVQADGSWAVTAAALPAWSYPIVVKVKDAAGNGATATQTMVVEVNPETIALGAADSFSVFGALGVAGSGISTLAGDLGVGIGGTIGGFPPGTVGGVIHPGDGTAVAAQDALLAAYADGANRAPHTVFADDQIGKTFHAGVHHTAAAFLLTGTMTLDGEGDPNAVFIFQIDAAMSPAANSHVVLVNGATAARVFWVVNGAVSTGANSSQVGTILANGAITLGASSTLTGRALATDLVTLGDNTVGAP